MNTENESTILDQHFSWDKAEKPGGLPPEKQVEQQIDLQSAELEQPTPEIYEDWFEKQFNLETIDVGDGQSVEILDIQPQEAKEGAAPILFTPGYGDGSPEGRKANIYELAKAGRRVVWIKTPHGIESDELTKQGIPDTIQKQINAIWPVLDHKGIEKISMIGESRGGAISIAAAYLQPERFENITLIDPVGMTDKMNMAQLIIRFMSSGVLDAIKMHLALRRGEISPQAEQQMRFGPDKFKEFVKEDLSLSYEECRDIAKAQVYKMLKFLKAQGIGISIFHGVDDKVFPMAEMQKNISSEIAKFKAANPGAEVPEEIESILQELTESSGENEANNGDAAEKVIDGFYSITGSHGAFFTKPEVYTKAVEEGMTALEKKAEKNSA